MAPPFYVFSNDAGILPGPVPISMTYWRSDSLGTDLSYRMLNLVNDSWVDVTTGIDTTRRLISGTLNTLSAVAIVRLNSTVDVEAALDRPGVLSLDRPRPLPMRSKGTLGFTLPARGPVRLAVHDISGRRVVTLVDGVKPAGHHEVVWDGQTQGGKLASPGVYFLKLDAGGASRTRVLVMLR
jgi:hypothetical protein